MTISQNTLAQRVERMLEEALSFGVAVRHAPDTELAEITTRQYIVTPGDVTSTLAGRDGTRNARKVIQVHILAAVEPGDRAQVEAEIAACEQVAEILATTYEADSNDIVNRPFRVDHAPLYDPDQLRTGKFWGVVEVEYGV